MSVLTPSKIMYCFSSVNLKIIPLLLLLTFLPGCSENSEEAAFRASLIDKALNDDNAKLGVAFLQKNKQREDVVTMDSGLQYQILESGGGVMPGIEDSVEVQYEGRLVAGQIFDSSAARGKSSVFPLKSVIPGWRQALLNMRVGDKWKIFLPAKLAYGSRSPSAQIAANSALIFEIKILAIIGDKREQNTDN
ncbi:MAG: FKBP-type peptidyl-prolyl cis-trans isomerase [Pseudomonadales bacterium]|nr:FKBP-type peptidyl-prolyl cis-trans isomerase [Pseudomonadales bacterium]